MIENDISILALQETKSPHNKRETRKNHTHGTSVAMEKTNAIME